MLGGGGGVGGVGVGGWGGGWGGGGGMATSTFPQLLSSEDVPSAADVPFIYSHTS